MTALQVQPIVSATTTHFVVCADTLAMGVVG